MRGKRGAAWACAFLSTGCVAHDQPVGALGNGGLEAGAPDRAAPDVAMDVRAPDDALDAPDASGDAPFDEVCSSTPIDVRATPPNVLVLLQRSCSMAQRLNGPATPVKWDEALSAIATLTSTYATQVRFGLMYFPAVGGTCGAIGGATCGQINPQTGGAPRLGPALMTPGVAPTAVTGCSAVHDSPLATALDGARALAGTPSFPDPARDNYVLLISDGEERCLGGAISMSDESAPLAMRVSALRSPASPVDVRTVVVGFGSEINAINLQAMARAGGEPAPGATPYYSADATGVLLTQLSRIVAATISCTLPLAHAPTDPSRLELFVNGATTALARDGAHAEGWDYDPASNSVTLYGTPCADARAGLLVQANLVQLCAAGPRPPAPPMCRREGESCALDSDCCGLGALSCAAGACRTTPG